MNLEIRRFFFRIARMILIVLLERCSAVAQFDPPTPGVQAFVLSPAAQEITDLPHDSSAQWAESVAISSASSSVASPEQPAGDERSSTTARSSSSAVVRNSTPVDSNDKVFYKNKLEFSLEGGWLPINIPFVFDVFLGDAYTMTPLRYTLVPIIASLRWQMGDVGGPWIFRGNWDLTFSGSVTAIPRGPETRYFSYIMGLRRNFVPRHGRITPYFDYRLGMGNIDAKEPEGVAWAQGQDFTFTMNMGSGARYNFNPRYAIAAGINWMHISNLYLSEPKYHNYGINVYGPMFGIDIRLGKVKRETLR